MAGNIRAVHLFPVWNFMAGNSRAVHLFPVWNFMAGNRMNFTFIAA
jgi:hypothetical protein